MGTVVLFENCEGRELIREICEERRFLFTAFEELVRAEVEQTGRQRRTRLWSHFDDILDRIGIED